jgi:hypothetical protein
MIDGNGYDSYVMYTGIKLHFTTKSYDYFKYSGKINVSKDTFLTKKDKYHYYRLSRKYKPLDFRDFLVANFLYKSNIWVGELLDDEAHSRYNQYLKINQSLAYHFEQEFGKLLDTVNTPNELLQVIDGQYPILLQSCLQNTVSIQTVTVLNDLLNFIPVWEKKISDDIVFPEYANKIKKFAPFMQYDRVKMKRTLINMTKVEA